MVGVRSLDAHAGLVAGDDLGGAHNGLGLRSLDFEPGMGADEHVHQRALADVEPESISEQAAQTLIGKRLEALEINRQRMDARPERRRRRHRGRRSFRLDAAMPASAGEPTVADYIGLDRRDLDLVVLTDQFPPGVGRERTAARLANARNVVAKLIGIVRQPTVVRFMSRLRPARTGILTLLLLVRRRRLGRRARRLVRPLKPEHQLNQLLFAELLQITAIHAAMDSEIAPPRKGVGNCKASGDGLQAAQIGQSAVQIIRLSTGLLKLLRRTILCFNRQETITSQLIDKYRQTEGVMKDSRLLPQRKGNSVSRCRGVDPVLQQKCIQGSLSR